MCTFKKGDKVLVRSIEEIIELYDPEDTGTLSGYFIYKYKELLDIRIKGFIIVDNIPIKETRNGICTERYRHNGWYWDSRLLKAYNINIIEHIEEEIMK